MSFRFSLLVLSLVSLSACSSTRPTEPGTQLPTPGPTTIDHSDYETFDAGQYGETPPDAADAGEDPLDHDVPATLMENRAPEGGSGVVYAGPGYRVQVFQSTSKDEADRKVNEAVAWWRRSAGQMGLNNTPEVYTVYRAPYYRVRVGNFQTRDAARSFQSSLSLAFDGAFIVQDRVTVRR